MKAVALPKDTIQQVIRFIPEDAKQARRMVAYLAQHPNATTVEVAANCAIGNLSDVAHKINPILYPRGLFISCQRPIVPIPNRFAEPSGMWLWGLYEVPSQAANDDDYNISEGRDNGSIN